MDSWSEDVLDARSAALRNTGRSLACSPLARSRSQEMGRPTFASQTARLFEWRKRRRCWSTLPASSPWWTPWHLRKFSKLQSLIWWKESRKTTHFRCETPFFCILTAFVLNVCVWNSWYSFYFLSKMPKGRACGAKFREVWGVVKKDFFQKLKMLCATAFMVEIRSVLDVGSWCLMERRKWAVYIPLGAQGICLTFTFFLCGMINFLGWLIQIWFLSLWEVHVTFS